LLSDAIHPLLETWTAPGEYERVKIGARLLPSGKVVAPTLLDADRAQRITLPSKPAVGEVLGLAVSGDHGCVLHFEMQATKGSGRTVPLGSIQRVMRESIETAAQYVRANHAVLGISAEWRQSFDVAVLATYMGVPKEGPSAGVAMVTGIVSALRGIPVRHDLAMTGEITIMGKVLPVGGVQQKVRAAYDAGIREVLLPADNLKEAQGLPRAILESVQLTAVDRIDQVLERALLRLDGATSIAHDTSGSRG
jgi:ATP-dependent Lon protease